MSAPSSSLRSSSRNRLQMCFLTFSFHTIKALLRFSHVLSSPPALSMPLLFTVLFPLGLAFQCIRPPITTSRYTECADIVETFKKGRIRFNLHFSTVVVPEKHHIIEYSDVDSDSGVEFLGMDEQLESQKNDSLQSPTIIADSSSKRFSRRLKKANPISSLNTIQTPPVADSVMMNAAAGPSKSTDPSSQKASRSDKAWMKKYQLLLDFRCENQQNQNQSSVLLVPTTHPTLGRWTQRQRSEYKQGEMAIWRIKALEEVGFVWNVKEYQRQFKQSNNEVYVDEEDAGSNPIQNENGHENGKKRNIAIMTNLQPKNCSKKWIKLTWDERYAQLVNYHRIHGHVNVPLKDPIYSSLGGWVQYQRRCRYPSRSYYSSKSKLKSSTSPTSNLTEDQIRKLDNLGFVWDMKEYQWMERYRQLVEFVAKYGHCHVPSKGGIGNDGVDYTDHGVDYKTLQAWCGTQRHLYRSKYKLDQTRIQQPFYSDDDDCDDNGVCDGDNEGYSVTGTSLPSMISSPLTDEREALLNKIDFDWDTNHSYIWKNRIAQLGQYKRRYGHINLTKADDTNGAESEFDGLGSWLDTQRTEYRFKMDGLHTHLTSKRVEDLESLGIVWSIRDLKWNTKYEEVKTYFVRQNMLQDEAIASESSCDAGEYRNENHALLTGLVSSGSPIDKLSPSLSMWLRDQKCFYEARLRGESTPLSDDRAKKLKMLFDVMISF